jgi:ADP-ribosyl-[dinitrogen reductase] hydrolase
VSSLEAALWCFHNADDFDSVVLQAANLGDDADTTAAVAGQLAGAFHGTSGIRPSWLERLALRDQILDLGLRLGMAGGADSPRTTGGPGPAGPTPA